MDKQNRNAEQEEPTILIRPAEVARLLGIGRTKVYEMLGAGQLPTVRMGVAVRVPRNGLFEWLESQTLKVA